MGAKKQTIGYHYLMSLLSGICRGPINSLVAIKVGDKIAFTGPLCDDDTHSIDSPNLFGGEKKEGGIQGPFRLFMGDAAQVLPGASTAMVSGGKPYNGNKTLPDVKASIGGMVSEFRGVVTLWFDGLISSMNPYPKEWKFRVRRSTRGWYGDVPWYPRRATIFLAGGTIHAMNAAHIIFECSTNPEWGRGLSPDDLDINSFVYAANKLCDEGFGLCIIWYRKEDIDAFIKTVCDHVGAVYYTDRETGKIVFRLIRDDYNINDLPLFTPESGLISIDEDDSQSSDSAYNEVIVTGHDPITDTDIQQRAHNLAARQAQGAPATLDLNYPGLPTNELCARVAERDMRVHAAGLKKYTVSLDRRAWRLTTGMPFRISDPRRGIENIVLRAGEIDDGSMAAGRINMKAVQDVFGLPATSFVTPATPTWEPPPVDAEEPLYRRMIEASYRDVYLKQGQSTAEGLDNDDAVIAMLAVAPNNTSFEYDLATKAEGEPDYEVWKTGPFTGTAVLLADIGPLDTEITVTNPIDITDDLIGQVVMLDDELILIAGYDDETATLTVERGTVDTIPAPHLAGARVWTVDDDAVSDDRLYASGETVYGKVLTRTSADVLDIALAPEDSVELVARQARPYPPGDVKVDGDSVFTSVGEHAEPIITWAHRDRILQADQPLAHGEPSVGPEAGTTYNIRIYALDDTLIRDESGIVGDTYTYLASDQAADSAPSIVMVELESEREGLASWQKYRFKVILQSGYGYGYGFNYGGA